MTSLRGLIQANDSFVFDVDDTLLYTFRNGYRKVQVVAKALGCFGPDYDEYASCYGVLSFKECLMRWFPQTDVTVLVQNYREASVYAPYEPVCNFSEIQSLLLRWGKQTAILTNGHNDTRLRQKLAVCGVDESLLVGLWGAEDLPAPKPSALAMLPVKEQFHSHSILYIGDAEVDKNTALAAGVNFLQVCTGKDGPLPGVPCIPSLQTLIDCLRLHIQV